MSRLVSKSYNFDVVPGVEKARIYFVSGSEAPGYDAPFVDVPVPAGQTTMSYSLPGQTAITDGPWTLGATQFDAAGNESDMGAVVTFPFDFTPLPAPTNGRIV